MLGASSAKRKREKVIKSKSLYFYAFIKNLRRIYNYRQILNQICFRLGSLSNGCFDIARVYRKVPTGGSHATKEEKNKKITNSIYEL